MERRADLHDNDAAKDGATPVHAHSSNGNCWREEAKDYNNQRVDPSDDVDRQSSGAKAPRSKVQGLMHKPLADHQTDCDEVR